MGRIPIGTAAVILLHWSRTWPFCDCCEIVMYIIYRQVGKALILIAMLIIIVTKVPRRLLGDERAGEDRCA